jgi:hypothetical protein
VTDAPAIATDSEVRGRLRRAVQSPSGVAVLRVLREHLGAPLTASTIARLGFVSTSAARDQAWRLARLGWARQTTVSTGSMPAMAWEITPRGLAYCSTELPERRVSHA